jgi:hypothetical protein
MNERTISSSLTPLMKFVFPIVWISLFGFGTLAIFLIDFHGQGIKPPPKWIFLAGWVLASIILWRSCMRLKKVRVGVDAIYVSNFQKEIRIPFEEIINVTENRWINIRPITIYFRSETIFGRHIIFMPTRRFSIWQAHPVVGELRTLAHLPAQD